MGPEEAVLLLTDVVESTAINAAVGDEAMRALWQEHDVRARECMRTWRGREIARSDGFLVLFESALDAACFAVDYHALMRSLLVPLKARVGVHAGPVSLRENSDQERLRGAPALEVDGLALPIAARVMSAAMGGQTLLTAGTVRALLVPPDSDTLRQKSCRAVSQGHWRLKGVDDPIELFEIGDENSPFRPPVDSGKAYRVAVLHGHWVPVHEIQNNLPAERNDFVGRADVLRSLSAILQASPRLVTLTGIGGVGKTRLALQYARERLGDFPGGIYFCDLTTASTVDGIAHVLARALDVALAKKNVVDHLSLAVRGRGQCLLILDNFEQVTALSEQTVGAWLERAPEVKIIVTSRELLAIPGEQAFSVPPLADAEGSELFRSRARDAVGSPLPDANEDDIKTLVQLLDGLPLAIELAAARARVMSPTALLRRMNERFALLAMPGPARTRRATLRATLDWSWDLLPDFERGALAQLTVFEGGFQLEAVEAVVDLSEFAGVVMPVDALQSLGDKSLVRRLEGNRFDLLVTVRSYVTERLERPNPGAGQRTSVGAATIRHERYYASTTDDDVLSFAVRELDNIVAACRHATERGATANAVRALEMAWHVLKLRGPLSVAIALASAIGAKRNVLDDDAGRTHRIQGGALYALGRANEARQNFERGLAFATRARNLRLQCQLRCSLGDQEAASGHMDAARSNLETALELAREIEDSELQCIALNSLGDYRVRLGQLDDALRDFQHALVSARLARARRWEGGILGNLGLVKSAQGLHKEALQLYESSCSIARELGDRSWEGNALCNLGMTSQALGRLDDASRHLSSALTIAREIGQKRLEAFTVCNLGITAQSMGDLAAAVEQLSKSVELARELGDRRLEAQSIVYLSAALAKTGQGEAALEHIEQAVHLLEDLSDPMSLGFALARRAELEAQMGRTDVAREAWQRAESIARDVQPSGDSEFGAALVEVRRIFK
jgi:predicted ATPase/class 3 adenylate cyclase/Tfp pilus assembly protein PilF